MDLDEKTLVDLSPYWEVEDSEYNYCDCPGPPPPPQFVIPPPPPPPSLDLCRGGAAGAAGGGGGGGDAGSELQFCHLEPVGAEYTQATFPSLPIIVVCSSVVLVALLVASFLLWKHKKKVQNFLPCKTEPHQGHHCDMAGSNGVTYDDVLINHHPTRLPNHHHHHTPETRHGLTPIELLDVKCGTFSPAHLAPLSHTNFTFAPAHKEPSGVRLAKNKDHFNPIYEEVSGCSEEKPTSRSYDSDIEDSEAEARTVASEDEFAEDELSLAEFPRPATATANSRPCSGTSSLQGSTGGDLCRDVASVSSEGAGSEGGNPENLRGLFRGHRGGVINGGTKGRVQQPKHTHSLERNKDGHPSEGFLAKQNYYMSKSMLGPDLAMANPSPLVKAGSVSGHYPADQETRQSLNNHHPYAQSLGRLASNHLSTDSPPPYTSTNRANKDNAYGPFGGKMARLPGALLSELNHKFVGNGNGNGAPNRTMGSPGAQGVRGPPVFTVDPEDPYSPPSMGGPRMRGGPDFTTFHPYPSTPNQGPVSENIYASVEDDGPFTIDGGHLRRGSFSASRDFNKAPSSTRGSQNAPNSTHNNSTNNTSSTPSTTKTPGKLTSVPKDSTSNGGGGHPSIPNQRTPNNQMDEENGSYGDIRPIYDTRTVCT